MLVKTPVPAHGRFVRPPAQETFKLYVTTTMVPAILSYSVWFRLSQSGQR